MGPHQGDNNELEKSQATLVFGQMNEPPCTCGFAPVDVAEYFRDGDEQSGGRDILFFIDNIFRFTQAGSEVSALLGRMPSAVGYQLRSRRKWVRCRSASPLRSVVRSRLCKGYVPGMT